MNVISKLLLGLAFMAFFGCNTQKETAEAEPPKDRREARREMMQQRQEELKEVLALSPEQAAKFDEINKEYGAKMQAMRANGEINRETFQQFNQMRMNEIENMLTDAQMGAYKAYMTEQMKKRRGGG